MKSRSIMRCMLLALLFLVVGLVWTPNIMAQSCTASNSADIIPNPTTVGTGDPIAWQVKIRNNSHTNPGGLCVDAKLLADGSANHPPFELFMDQLSPTPATFLAKEKVGDGGDEDGICENGEKCDCDLIAGMNRCEGTANANVVLLYTDPGGVLFSGCPDEKSIVTLRAIATSPVASAPYVAITFLDGKSSAGGGVFNTNDADCNPQVWGAASTSAPVFYSPEPCIHVTKSVDPTFTKPTDSVTYTIELCNCGDGDLTGITVSDTKLGGDLVPPFPSTLAKGTVGNPNCVTKNIPHTIPPGTNVDVPYVNTVTVDSNETEGLTGGGIVKVATASVDLFKPDVTISKACDCIESDPDVGCQVGDDVKYKITVTNLSTTNTPSLTCTIKDPDLNVNKSVTWDPSPGLPNITNKTIPFPDIDEDCLTNTATLHCTIAGFPNVIDKDASCEVCKVEPSGEGGEEPFKAAVKDDKQIPDFYISPKLDQFTHPNTDYYATCNDVLKIGDPRINENCEIFGAGYKCPSACRENFKYHKATAVNQPEVCCTSETVDDNFPSTVPDQNFVHCPDTVTNPHPPVKTALISYGNGGSYEWIIALPKKPADELNIEIECGVLKPNAWKFFNENYDTINLCAAVTGEPIGPGLCKRLSGAPLKAAALPKITAIAHPGCLNDFKPFHLTAYRSPSKFTTSSYTKNTEEHQVLDGSKRSSVALKACLEESIMVLWPKEGRLNAYDKDQNPSNGLQPETETALHAGDLIKIRLDIPKENTVDIYCSQYSVTIGGIGIPFVLDDDPRNCPCIKDVDCTLDEI